MPVDVIVALQLSIHLLTHQRSLTNVQIEFMYLILRPFCVQYMREKKTPIVKRNTKYEREKNIVPLVHVFLALLMQYMSVNRF